MPPKTPRRTDGSTYVRTRYTPQTTKNGTQYVYFGREVAEGNRELVAAFDLKKRPYLGPTSMDNELALVMANMVLAGKGRLCFDPFVGTGSILVVREVARYDTIQTGELAGGAWCVPS